MRAKTTRTIAVSSKEIESAIEALSSAGQAFKLTPFQRRSYQALMNSIDWSVAALVAALLSAVLYMGVDPSGNPLEHYPVILSVLIFIAFMIVGLIGIVVNIPLILKTIRDRWRLYRLGFSSLAKSLWIESRRSRWISVARGALLFMFGTFGLVCVGLLSLSYIDDGRINNNEKIVLIIVSAITFLLLGALFLRNLRERIDLTASAEELRNALQSLQLHAGKNGVVSVPSELLEQAAKIETAQIAKERKDAVLQSVALRPTEYAIAYDRDAARQRATLGVSDRVELEDLVAQLSTDGGQLGPQARAVGEATFRRTTKSKRVEIEYVIDDASRGIRIAAVRRG